MKTGTCWHIWKLQKHGFLGKIHSKFFYYLKNLLATQLSVVLQSDSTASKTLKMKWLAFFSFFKHPF